jgi:TrmH family RNA methyltransferase
MAACMMSSKIKLLQEIVRTKKARDESGLVVIEGDKIVEELYKEGRLESFITDDTSFTGRPQVEIVESFVIQKISSCRSPQHHLGVAKLPKMSTHLGSWVLVLDRLQDPGNVGMLTRCALSLGWEGLFLIEPACDLFNDKALRSSRGASLKLPFKRGTIDEMAQEAKKAGSQVIVADLKGEKPALQQQPAYLVLGSEGQGVQRMGHDRSVAIPMNQRFESLNVASAGSILLYVLRQS